MEFELDGSLKEWAKDKPLSILQLDPADRAVLRIAGESHVALLISLLSPYHSIIYLEGRYPQRLLLFF